MLSYNWDEYFSKKLDLVERLIEHKEYEAAAEILDSGFSASNHNLGLKADTKLSKRYFELLDRLNRLAEVQIEYAHIAIPANTSISYTEYEILVIANMSAKGEAAIYKAHFALSENLEQLGFLQYVQDNGTPDQAHYQKIYRITESGQAFVKTLENLNISWF